MKRHTRLIVAALIVAATLTAVSAEASTALKLPPGVPLWLALRMYSEQVQSAPYIDQLVAGGISSFKVTGSSATSDTTTLDMDVKFKSEGTQHAVMRLRKAGGKWYFWDIRHANSVVDAGPVVTDPDVGVLNTMLQQQAANSATISKLADGTYTTINVGTAQPGFRSTLLPVTFVGASKPATGSVTAISRVQDEQPMWFLASFSNKQ